MKNMRMREDHPAGGQSCVDSFHFAFGLYVHFHGDFGPGGGFQAGVIFTAGLVLYGLIFGLEPLREWRRRGVEIAMAVGVILYAGTGVVSLALGERYLDYDALGHHGQHYGILLVEAGVGITVTSTILMIFYAFAGEEEA